MDAEPLFLFSADGHAGPPTEHFRPYLERKYHAQFDEFLATFEKKFEINRGSTASNKHYATDFLDELFSDEERTRFAALSDPHARLAVLEADGVVGDVIFVDAEFGNGPPFLGGIGGHDFDQAQKMEITPDLAFAGAQAYNRWLGEYCSVAPERLRGIALLGSLHDVDRAVREIQTAKRAGLHGGILLPLHYAGVPFYNDACYEPIWATCAELQMPVHTHAGGGVPQYGTGPEAFTLYAVEHTWFAHRPLWFMILAGVLERHRELKLVFTEQGATWVIEANATMDGYWGHAFSDWGKRQTLPSAPSAYWQRQCYVGALLLPEELERRAEIGIDKIMWGADFPHFEGQWQDLHGCLRESLTGIPESEVRAIVGGNAASAYGLNMQALRPIAERIGPKAAELVTAKPRSS